MKDQLQEAIWQSFRSLLEDDGVLLDCPIENDADYEARKLHEVCLNHRLACHLEACLAPLLATMEEKMFVDIEFNRKGVDFKTIPMQEQEKCVRPDIIVHNRKSDNVKTNLLVVECKRKNAQKDKIREDRHRLDKFMKDENYEYSYGVQVLYEKHQVCGCLYFKENGVIHSEEIKYPNYSEE